ncbi:hypothetical protein CFIMG_007978RA00001 [Ceratocystis fimbriata CBS 114723]|uniref:Uncharacterized protein n=1 Tax=Ceratocystis fimbriata CBS 114723 TaxID=1035309 RepID=A0A2C5XAM3_9PEZI|nr:hypothetical protein CFIMG_007978RA00001 [Ceratocystis fimbriata CBS 114723]
MVTTGYLTSKAQLLDLVPSGRPRLTHPMMGMTKLRFLFMARNACNPVPLWNVKNTGIGE